MSASTDHAALSRCENCGTALQGHYCHVCGQRAHNPLRHFAHAVEEVLESFWHLDGRVFRTMADLFVPGRVAGNYLAGHRTRYLPPLRLFIILSLATFFVGKLTLHFDPSSAIEINTDTPTQTERLRASAAGDSDNTAIFRSASSVEDVLRLRADALRGIAETQNDPKTPWFVKKVTDLAEKQIETRARTRMQELGATPAQLQALDRPAGGDAQPATTNTAVPAATGTTTPSTSSTPVPTTAGTAANKTSKVESGFVERWFEQRLIRLKENAEMVQEKPDEFVRLVLGAAPGALFLLVPLFALCLKVLYLGSGRTYLEHLVVALYSHAMLLVALLVTFLLIGVQSWSATPWWLAAIASAMSALALSIVMPLYLLLMQKRVYAQSWLKTLLKFAMLGSVYSLLLGVAMLYAVLAGLSS